MEEAFESEWLEGLGIDQQFLVPGGSAGTRHVPGGVEEHEEPLLPARCVDLEHAEREQVVEPQLSMGHLGELTQAVLAKDACSSGDVAVEVVAAVSRDPDKSSWYLTSNAMNPGPPGPE